MSTIQQRISVIICAYTEERWQALTEAILSTQVQTYQPLEIIVVCDHNPALFQRICAHFSDILAIENQEERGLSGARNSGAAISRGEILAFLDDDAVALPSWLETLASLYSPERVLGVGGSINPFWSQRQPRWFPEEFFWVIGCTYRGMPVQKAVVRNLIGANMSLLRQVCVGSGGFRNDIGRVGSLPIGCEETELCIRAAQQWPAGVFIYHPDACVFHKVTPQRATWRYFVMRCYAEGLSKAAIARYVGKRDSLSSEYIYTLRTLPGGVLKGMYDTLSGDMFGLLRAGAIVTGLVVTAVGYLLGKIVAKRKVALQPSQTIKCPDIKQKSLLSESKP